MDIKSVYDIAGRAMAAQLVRLNTVASNLAMQDQLLVILKQHINHLNQFLRHNIVI